MGWKVRAKKQLGLLAAAPEHRTSSNVRAFHVQVDGSCQCRAGPSTSDSFVPTSTFTSSVCTQLLWHSRQTALSFIHVICTVLHNTHKTFSESYNTGEMAYLPSDLWEGFFFFYSQFKVVITTAGKALMCHNYTFGSLGCM